MRKYFRTRAKLKNIHFVENVCTKDVQMISYFRGDNMSQLNKSNRINIRLSNEDKELLEAAAKKNRQSLSSYIISAAIKQADRGDYIEESTESPYKCICSKEIMEFYYSAENYVLSCSNDLEKVKELYLSTIRKNVEEANKFANKLILVRKQLDDDLTFFMDSDPAVDSREEVILAYPGFKAIRYYRIAHELYLLNEKLFARIISEEAHKDTGVDIHPGATIESPFFIDHGTGIVIGETTVIGQRAKIYQSVTLGALSLAKGSKMKGEKRHPTIGNNVTIYAGVSILGGDVVIGDHVTIGSNVFLTESIPANMRVLNSKPQLLVQERK